MTTRHIPRLRQLFAASVLTLLTVACGSEDDLTDPSNQAPDVTISSPDEGAAYEQGEEVPFKGSADDWEDGRLTGDALVWESDVDGELGTGESLTRDDLSPGEHTVTLTATDSEGATGADTVAISVTEVPWREIPEEELDALIALYESTDGDNWVINTGWLNEEQPPSAWHGVTVEDGHVTELHLDARSLTGEIPPELGKLTLLRWLSLEMNNLSGEVPPELGSLRNLVVLDLQQNDLTGDIPPELGKLENLGSIVLRRNNLTGEIPPELGKLTNLSRLDLRRNNLTGEIPPELSNLGSDKSDNHVRLFLS